MKFPSIDANFARGSTSDIGLPMVLSKSPKTWAKPTDQMDSWLDSQGFYRKHIARDASSLFRCVSEVVFLTQVHHLNVRKHCIHFALFQSDTFKKLTNTPVKDYIERLSNPREWGTHLDMEVMSLLYGLDFAVYKEIKKPIEKVTNNGFKFSIILSMSYEHHYDSVYPKQHITDAGVCQSILYEILYKQVFKLEEVDYAVNKMLHDKSATHYQTDINMELCPSGYQVRLEMRDNCRNVKDLLTYGITPFPYKVAKSLDPSIYRNVEYDTWNDQRKNLRHLSSAWNDKELQIGSKCFVSFNEKNQIIKRHGYIQQMSPNKGPVVIYVQELGERLTVPFESLELIPVLSKNPENTNENDNEDLGETLTRPVVKDDKSSIKRIENTEVSSYGKVPTAEAESHYPTSSAPDICNVHYVRATTAVVPSNCYSCVTSQTFQSELNSVKSTPVGLHTNGVHERAKGNREPTTMDQSASISMQYTMPAVYPIVSPDMSVSQTVMPGNVIPSKSLTMNDYIGNASSARMVYNKSLDSYYKFGYSTYPYYVVPSGVIYPALTSDHSAQQNIDTSRVHYSYPLSQVPNEMMYALPVPNPTTKTDLPMYPTTPLVHPPASLNVKNSITMTSGVPATPIPPTYPAVSSSICPVTYPPYTPPSVYYHPYDYYFSCPDIQGCENVTASYPVQSYMPLAYSEDGYSANAQIYCQPLLPASHAQ